MSSTKKKTLQKSKKGKKKGEGTDFLALHFGSVKSRFGCREIKKVYHLVCSLRPPDLVPFLLDSS